MTDVPIGEWRTVEIFLPAAVGTLHIRPVDRPAVIELRELSAQSEDGRLVWSARTLPELKNLSLTGSLILLPAQDSCLFLNFGSDPIWLLPTLNEPVTAVTLKTVLFIHEDFEAVSEAIAAAYAQVDIMTAQVRTASAERNKLLREFQKRAEAVVEDRDHALRKWEEQAGLVQLENQRNAELQAQRDALESDLQALRAEHEALQQTLFLWEQSRSWRITRPLRSVSDFAQKLRKNID